MKDFESMEKKTSALLIDNRVSSKDLQEPFRGVVRIDNLPDLSSYDIVLVYDVPAFLPFWFKELKERGLKFKYHIVIYFDPLNRFISNNLLISHVGLLLAAKDFKPNKVRAPHQYCHFCKKPLKDWGGKIHLMHPEGYLISDVWKDLPLTYSDIIERTVPSCVVERVKKFFGKVNIVQGERTIVRDESHERHQINELSDKFKNISIEGDAIEKLKSIPSNSVDTIFIDPPYNLGKAYLNYEDERNDYVEWSIKWLQESFRILKPYGSLFLLNIPKWAHELAIELFPKYYLIRWIVWDEPAEPRGKLIPAHYSLLWMAKERNIRTYPLGKLQDSMNYCLRISCMKIRRSLGVDDKIEVRDVRWDIHRIKHRHKRFRFHPVQLPEKLLEFIIKLTTRKGDIILDPMCGTGTAPVVAKRLGRQFIGIDIDPTYIEITNRRLKGELIDILDTPKYDFKNGKYKLTKKWIQIKMGELAKDLNRLPTIDEASKYLSVKKEILFQVFPDWTKALKLAKIILE
ncbi:MAG: DNA methyltransferase, partial [Nitrososphaeria archaeon]